ncbi:MAG: penicillin acylase family protein [Bacteroidota bacterium]
MRLLPILLLFYLTSCTSTPPQSEALNNIKIARDEWGVPHIYAPTDAEVAYGLAWAECEDDFLTLQEQMAAGRGKLGEIKGQEGLIVDFAIKFMGLTEIAAERYDKEVTGRFKTYLESYAAGLNAYAALHPEEVLLDDLFPLTGHDAIVGYLLGNIEVSGAGKDLQKIMNGKIVKELQSNFPKGSNAIAVSNRKTTDSKTYLAINSHQPLEGWYSWYEAHLISDEGMNILGGTFPGGMVIFHGVNEHLGWAHTVNHADFSDVYKLTMHPDNELQYELDGEWLTLEEKHHWAWMKVAGPLKIPIRQTSYVSKYGPTFKTDDGFYAWRFAVGETIRMGEQWYKMNKATDFEEFQAALRIQGIACLNIVYADKEDNIYFLSNGRLPVRNPKYDWQSVLPGNTSETLWDGNIVPFDSLPQVLNPDCGWVFNTNNTPYSASDSVGNFVETALNQTMGYQGVGLENNRSTRFLELISQYDSLSYDDFKHIKYDRQYPSKMTLPVAPNVEDLLHLDPQKYPDIADAIDLLANWNREAYVDNTTAPLFILTWMATDSIRKAEDRVFRGSPLTENDCVVGIRTAKAKLLSKYGKLEVSLGEMQRHIRGDVNIPLGGAPDVLAAMYSVEQENGQYKGRAGDSYIELVRFGPDGVEIESVNAYGSSAKEGAEHFTSQMELFAGQKLKKMTLDKEEVFESAVRVYSPRRPK